VLPLAMHKQLDERNGEGPREWCQPKVWVSAREVMGKGAVDHPGCHLLSLIGVKIYSINPDYLQ